MKRHRLVAAVFAFALAALPLAASAQLNDPGPRLAAQRAAMAQFAYMDGVWRGPATTTIPSGEKKTIVQTERIGSFLDGTVKMIEGRGYGPDGQVSFNALGIVSYDVDKKALTMRAYSQGYAGDFPVTPRADGYSWVIPGGPNARIVYTATVKGDSWHEIGDHIVEGQPPLRVFEMTLKRVGAADWPAGNPIPPK